MIRVTLPKFDKHCFGILSLWAIIALLLASPATQAAQNDMAKDAAQQKTAAVGEPAPDFELRGADGRAYSLNDFEGDIVVLEWSNHECPYVRKHYDTDNMQTLQKEMTAQDVVWLTIVSSAPGKQGHTTAAEARDVMNDVKDKATARLLDPTGQVGRLYDAKTTPHMYVIDKNGILVYAGAIDDNPSADHSSVKMATNYVRAAVENLQNGEPVEIAQTRPYGCTIKY